MRSVLSALRVAEDAAYLGALPPTRQRDRRWLSPRQPELELGGAVAKNGAAAEITVNVPGI